MFAVLSFRIAFFTWKFTVSTDIARIFEISPDVLPSAAHLSTSTSRSVSPRSGSAISLGNIMRPSAACAVRTSQRIRYSFASSSAAVTGSRERTSASMPMPPYASKLDCAQPNRSPNDCASTHIWCADANSVSARTTGCCDRRPCARIGSTSRKPAST
ncbi:hypothetical protein DO72_5872 [Burkholderia pseudomallei]|nr:hypothetical protein DO72_5864 [Burkholderia pseudomallei]KGD34603.1 hypothetical protein DO72_5872 [Burkholderia pseudomallei]